MLETVDPGRTGLLLLDYQVMNLSNVPEADEMVSQVANVVERARAVGMQVAHVRMAFEEAEISAVPAHTMLAKRLASAGSALGVDAPGTAFDPRLTPQETDIVVRKNRVSGFSSTNLDQQLRARNVDTLIVGGLSTSAVVLSTIIDAFDRDYSIYLIADACADRSLETHLLLCENVFPRLATIVDFAGARELIPAT
jgi:nicotinamidase-related amidase